MERLLLSILFGLAIVPAHNACFAAPAAEEIPLEEAIDIEVEVAPTAPVTGPVPEKISKKPVSSTVLGPAAVPAAPKPQITATASLEAAVEDLSLEEAPAVSEETATESQIEGRAEIPAPTGPAPKGFDDFLKCGIALGKTPVAFDSQVVGKAGGVWEHAVSGEEVILEGSHPVGTKFTAYRAGRGSCLAFYLGMVKVLGPIDELTCRGAVSNVVDSITTGDLLFSYNALRSDFDVQRGMEGDEKYLRTFVRCIQGERRWAREPGSVIQLDSGRNSGVLWGQYFQAYIPGFAGKKTYGRVIRVDQESCFLKISKIYQVMQTGDEMESISRPGGQAPLKSP